MGSGRRVAEEGAFELTEDNGICELAELTVLDVEKWVVAPAGGACAVSGSSSSSFSVSAVAPSSSTAMPSPLAARSSRRKLPSRAAFLLAGWLSRPPFPASVPEAPQLPSSPTEDRCAEPELELRVEALRVLAGMLVPADEVDVVSTASPSAPFSCTDSPASSLEPLPLPRLPCRFPRSSAADPPSASASLSSSMVAQTPALLPLVMKLPGEAVVATLAGALAWLSPPPLEKMDEFVRTDDAGDRESIDEDEEEGEEAVGEAMMPVLLAVVDARWPSLVEAFGGLCTARAA